MVRNDGNRSQLSTDRRKISHFVWSLLGHKTSENRIQPSGEAGSNPALSAKEKRARGSFFFGQSGG
jgi:hypothetical protein